MGIHSLLKRQSFKPNIIDRDKILVPSNWDSWGKIRILTEGFDLEGMSTAWSIEIQDPPESSRSLDDEEQQQQQPPPPDNNPETENEVSAVTIYEQTIKDPKLDKDITPAHVNGNNGIEGLEVETSNMQTFLTEQLHNLEQLKIEDEKDRENGPKYEMSSSSSLDNTGRVNEHIGPVQFNMGGIQVDADDMLRKFKVSNRIPFSFSCTAGLCVYIYLLTQLPIYLTIGVSNH